MRTLGEVVEETSRTGESQPLTQEEWDNFRRTFAEAMEPEISRLRAERRKAFAEVKNMVVD